MSFNLPANLDPAISHVVETAIPMVGLNVKSNDMLAPVAFVGSASGLKIVLLSLKDEKDKEETTTLLRDLCKKNKATFVLLAMESWSLSDPVAVEDFIANRDRYPSISTHPAAVECVFFNLETLKHGSYSASALIQPGRELAEVSFVRGGVKGRLVNILPIRLL